LDKKKILIIDDETEVVQLLKKFLERKGNYEVLGLTDPKEVLPNLHLFRPDIILLDLLMPYLGGLEICEQLNDDEIGKTTPIIIMSALWKDTDKLKAFKLGVIAYLVKPVDREVLLVAVENALRFKRQAGKKL
jgi:DNA-binding response OmpR family regulator